MEDEQVATRQATAGELQFVIEELRRQQSFGAGFMAGGAAAVIGAVVWAAITYTTKYQIGFMAIGLGFLVGYSVLRFGKGVESHFGLMGAVLSLFGCVLGNFLAISAVYAHQFEMPLMEVFSAMTWEGAGRLMQAGFSGMDLLFYAIAVYQGYRLSFRALRLPAAEEVTGMSQG